MALIACTNKQKKHRIKASGNLPRTDYYCPHKGCNAVMTLVDCDDEGRTDHFRTKPSSSHSEDCPYSKNDVYLQDNGFTNVENKILEDALNKLRDDLEFLQKQVKVVLLYTDVSLSSITTEVLTKVGYNPKNKTSLNKVETRINKICELLAKYNEESIKVNKEYLSIIFKCTNKEEKPYYYSYPQIGKEGEIGDSVFEELHSDDLAVADVHTHGATRKDIGDEIFSTKDFDSLDSSKEKYTRDFVSYLVTPSGVLRKTDGEKEDIVKYNMPRDSKSPFEVRGIGFLYDRRFRKLIFVPFRAISLNDVLMP